MATRVHIVGASGSGTTSLGRALAHRFGCPHFDTDDYFWLPTDPPFEKIRERAEPQALLGADLARHDRWVLSGSPCGWGDLSIPLFDLVVFLAVPPDIRLARLRDRERARYGEDAIAPGGSRHDKYLAFIAWAAFYDEGETVERNRRMHERWLAALPCPVLRLDGTEPLTRNLDEVLRRLS
jgi:adenylate kinase family enzyme